MFGCHIFEGLEFVESGRSFLHSGVGGCAWAVGVAETSKTVFEAFIRGVIEFRAFVAIRGKVGSNRVAVGFWVDE